MQTIEKLMIAYTVWLFRIFEITPEKIERSRPGQVGVFALRPEGARGIHF